MKIGTRDVGPGSPVFIIAEAGSNHGGSLDRAFALIDAAADAGADAVKFQRFRVDKFLVPRPDPEALRRYELPDDWLPTLKARCDERGVEFLCTAFDLDSLDVVDPFVNAHKIGSYEATNFEYLQAVTRKGKPVLVSNGRTMLDRHGNSSITLQCVSAYPALIEHYLGVVALKNFDRWQPWGVSDHTLHPTIVPCAAVALGACVVEKHFRGDFADETPDSAVSIYSQEFADLVEAVRLTEKAVR